MSNSKLFNHNKKSMIVTNLKTKEVHEFESMKMTAEFIGLSRPSSIPQIIRRENGIFKNWKLERKI